MSDHASTLKEAETPRSDQVLTTERSPGIALLFRCGTPTTIVIPLVNGCAEVGRGSHGMDPDQRMSRRHARIQHDGRRFLVTDLGSHNGTAVDGLSLIHICHHSLTPHRCHRCGCKPSTLSLIHI